MQIRTSKLVWSAVGLFAVGTVTGSAVYPTRPIGWGC